jgi:hypothetical protein
MMRIGRANGAGVSVDVTAVAPAGLHPASFPPISLSGGEAMMSCQECNGVLALRANIPRNL